MHVANPARRDWPCCVGACCKEAGDQRRRAGDELQGREMGVSFICKVRSVG